MKRLKMAVAGGVVTALLMALAVSCGGAPAPRPEDTTLKEVEDMLARGILDPIDLSLSPLEGLALPQVEVTIPDSRYPSLNTQFSWRFAVPTLSIQVPTVSIGNATPGGER